MRIRSHSESDFVADFLSESKAQFAPELWIKRIIDPVNLGTPDIYAVYKGIFLPIEAKRGMSRLGFILDHHFKEIQVHELKLLRSAGAYSMGLIFMQNDRRFILPDEISETGNVTIDQFNKLPYFSWRTILDDYHARSKSISSQER